MGQIPTSRVGADRRFDAVVFDLFGTLVPQLPHELFRSCSADIALALGADPDAVQEQIVVEFPLRMNGAIRDGDEQFAPLCRALGIDVTQDQLRAASAVWHAFLDWGVTPKPGAVAMLTELRAREYGLALCTDCSSSTEARVDAMAFGPFFEVRACSADVGVAKPDPRMYRHVIDGLGVDPTRCLYVGDGGSREHWGAQQHGMTTVWIDEPGAPERHDVEQWVDHRIVSLGEVIELL